MAFVTTRLILLAFRGARYVSDSGRAFGGGAHICHHGHHRHGLLFGLVCRWIETRSDPAYALRSANRSTPASALLPQRLLVIAQAALSLILLTGAGLLTKSLRNLEHQHFGFPTDQRVLVKVDPAFTGYAGARLASTYRRLEAQLSRIPGVISASLSMYSRRPEITGMITFTWKEPARRTNLALYGTTVPARATLRRWAPPACSKPVDRRLRPAALAACDGGQSDVCRPLSQEPESIGAHFGMGRPAHASDYEIVGTVEDTKYLSTYQPAYPTFFLPLFQMESPMVRSIDNFIRDIIRDIELHISRSTSNWEPLLRRTIEEVDPSPRAWPCSKSWAMLNG